MVEENQEPRIKSQDKKAAPDDEPTA